MKNTLLAAVWFALGVVITILFFTLHTPSAKKQAAQSPTATNENENPNQNPLLTNGENPCAGYRYELLPPPKFAASVPAQLATDRRMEVKILWEGVNGSKGYNIYVEDKKGRLIRKYETKRTVLYLRDIPLPEEGTDFDYQVRIATVNGADQPGNKGEPRPLHISRQASVIAPTLKKIEVED